MITSYTIPPEFQVENDCPAIMDDGYIDLCDEDKEPQHAAYEASCRVLRLIGAAGDTEVLERALSMVNYVANHADCYADAWKTMRSTFPALLGGVNGLSLDSDLLTIVKTCEARVRARREGRFSFSPIDIRQTAQGLAKQHAEHIHKVSMALELPSKAPYFIVQVNQAKRAAAFLRKQSLTNASKGTGWDYAEVDRYRRKKAVDERANYCTHAMQTYQEHGGVVAFVTMTLPKSACGNLDLAADTLKSIMQSAQGEGLALKRGIGGMWVMEEHKSHAPHTHTIIGFPNQKARDWFLKRLRQFYKERVRKLEPFCFQYRIPSVAIKVQYLSHAQDSARVSGYCLKDTNKPFAHLMTGRKVGMFGTLYRGGYFEDEIGQTILIPSMDSFAKEGLNNLVFVASNFY